MGVNVEKVFDWLSGHAPGGKERREATVSEWIWAYRSLFLVTASVGLAVASARGGEWHLVVLCAAAALLGVWALRDGLRNREDDED